tara:strand:+ start:578 stop:844 length:267 start_codon:yes stop_codon:yes gene_type:complete
MDLKNHILINLTEKHQGLLMSEFCSSWYDFSEPVDKNVGGVLIRESLSSSILAKIIGVPIEDFKLLDRHNCSIPIYSISSRRLATSSK